MANQQVNALNGEILYRMNNDQPIVIHNTDELYKLLKKIHQTQKNTYYMTVLVSSCIQ